MKRNTFQSSSSVGDIKKGSGATKLCYQTVDGSTINLDVINHQPSVCQEFIVTSPKFNYCRWMLWTVGFYALGCILQIHLQDVHILSGIIIILCICLLLKLTFKVHKESLLVVASVGVQLTTTFASGRQTAMFYDIADVSSIVINEAVTMHRVIYYLSLLLGHSPAVSQRLVPLFTHSWPSLRCLVFIHQQVTQLLSDRRPTSSVWLKAGTHLVSRT